MSTAGPPAAGTAGVRRLHHAWVVAGVGFVTLHLANGFRSTPSVLMVPRQRDFGWSRATISSAVSVNLVLVGPAGPFAAASLTRFGGRRVVLLALTACAGGSALTVLLFIAFYGLDRVATVPPTIALCADVAGPDQTSVVFGWVFASDQVGAACAAYATGLARRLMGTCSPAFVTSGVLCPGAAALAWSVGRGRRRPQPPAVPVLTESGPLA